MTWSRAKRTGGSRQLICALAFAGALTSTNASAQVGEETTSTGAKATVGLALLGAESVMAIEAAFGVQPWWAYAAGGGVGAIGGGVGGYFIDKAGNSKVSMSLLVGGLVFAVPTTIAVLSATAYRPPKNPEIDSGEAEKEAAIDRFHLNRYKPTPSLVGLSGEGVKMEVPAVSVSPTFSETTRRVYGLRSSTSVEVPVFNLSF